MDADDPGSPQGSHHVLEAEAPRHRRWLSIGLWIASAVIALVAAFHIGGGWYFASQLDRRALSAAERRESLAPDYDLRIVAVDDRTITIARSDEDDALRLEGVWGLAWEGGYGQLRDILSEDAGAVVRSFEVLRGEPPAPGVLAELDRRAFPGDPNEGFGIPFQDVVFEGDVGQFPAWFIDGDDDTWVIYVHGNGMTRRDALRSIPIAVDAAMPALVITYRGDEGAPDDPSRKLQYGRTEWRDLEAAVGYAVENGANDVILHGYSMGGGVILAFLLESSLSDRVAGVVLDAPMLDFNRTVEFQAADEDIPVVGIGLPRTLVESAQLLATIRFDVDWDRLNYLARADELEAPILLIHGDNDEDVPKSTSDELARLRPDIVTYVEVADAAHVEAWNVDPEFYEDEVARFIERVAGD
ncbi:MAG TPA: alpha/beta fold hydrolase [Tepidiformaceae bacterium]|nr:alpha/beta fold hydrolase [Tepidiformaceae bacterium]